MLQAGKTAGEAREEHVTELSEQANELKEGVVVVKPSSVEANEFKSRNSPENKLLDEKHTHGTLV